MKRRELEVAYGERGRQIEEMMGRPGRQAARFRRDPDKLSQARTQPGRKAAERQWANGPEPTGEQSAKAVTKTSQLASGMKHSLGVGCGKIRPFIEAAHQMPVARGTRYRADVRLALKAKPVCAEWIALIRQLVQIHVAETSWRIGTDPAWLGVFCGPGATVYTIRTSGGHEVVLDISGRQFRGYLTSDGLLTDDAAALAKWLQQKWLAPILRNLKALPADNVAAWVALAEAATTVPKDAPALRRQRGEQAPAAYARAAAAIEQRLDEVIAAHHSAADDDGARMARHLTEHRVHLLPLGYEPGLEPTDNEAERELRPGVSTRKIGGCHRTVAGAEAFDGAGAPGCFAVAVIAERAAFKRDSESTRKLAPLATVSPAARPPVTSYCPPAWSPTVTSRGDSFPPPSATKTTFLVPLSRTTSSGTTRALRGRPWIVTWAYISGFSSSFGLGTSMRTFTVRVFSSTAG
jgi:hypothetical protein